MRARFLFMILLFFGLSSFAQKMTGLGGELSIMSLKPNVRMWVTKTTGFEVFGGISSELTQFRPNDFEAGFKFLSTFLYERTNRTYFGLVGKWKWVNFDKTSSITANLPVYGVLIGKEWSSKRKHRKGFAVEFGYQYGTKEYQIFNPITHGLIAKEHYDEFPLILNIRYSFYKK